MTFTDQEKEYLINVVSNHLKDLDDYYANNAYDQQTVDGITTTLSILEKLEEKNNG